MVLLSLMPTTRPRHLITETDDMAVALDEAARRWPDLSRGQLVARLALTGAEALRVEEEASVAHRRRVAASAGRILSGTDARTALAALREEDWGE